MGIDLKDLTDEKLLSRLLSDSEISDDDLEECWKEFLLRLSKTIKDAIRSVNPTIRRQDLEDLIQLIYVKICDDDFQALRLFRCEGDNLIKLYIFNLAKFQAIDHFRHENSIARPSITYSLSEPIAEQDASYTRGDRLISTQLNPEEALERKELLEKIFEIIKSEREPITRARDRKIIDACLEGYSRTEIAEMEDIGLTRAGINTRFFRLKARIKELFDFKKTKK